MKERELRVIKAFINCVKNNQYTLDYATTLIEDSERYGYLTEESKQLFYNEFIMPIEEEIKNPIETDILV